MLSYKYSCTVKCMNCDIFNLCAISTTDKAVPLILCQERTGKCLSQNAPLNIQSKVSVENQKKISAMIVGFTKFYLKLDYSLSFNKSTY